MKCLLQSTKPPERLVSKVKNKEFFIGDTLYWLRLLMHVWYDCEFSKSPFLFFGQVV